ncbi:MAG: PfkB family carbohydrate kinase [Acidobacteriota bacterium]
MNTDVIGIGLAVLDHLMVVPEFPSGEGVLASSQYVVQGGGMVATALVAAQRLGCSAEFWGRVGDDEAGQSIVRELKAEGVGVSQVHVISGGRTGICFVMVKAGTGERSFVVHPQRNLFVDLKDYPLDRIKKCKILLIDATWIELAQQAAHFARANGIPVVADVHDPSQPSFDLLALSDYAIIPKQLADVMNQDGDYATVLQELRVRNVKYPIITLGKEGCAYLYQERVFRQPAFEVPVVDTTGAGDCFHGAFCFALARGLILPEAIHFASAAAALACTKLGGRSGIPNYEQTLEFMRSQGAKA